jgi:hypothetical protein
MLYINPFRFISAVHGPLLDDYSGAVAAYSLRELSASWSNQAVVEVRSSAGGSPASFTAAQVTNGALTNWVGAGNDGFVETWYDQSGQSRDISQPTTSLQPKIVENGSLILDANGKPEIDFRSRRLTRTETSGFPQPITAFALARTTKRAGYLINAGLQFVLGEWDGWGLYAGAWLRDTNGADTSALLNTHHLSTAVANGASSSVFANGTELVSGNAGTNGIPASYFNVGDSAHDYQGYVQEIIIYDSDQSSNRAGIEGNINAEYNI